MCAYCFYLFVLGVGFGNGSDLSFEIIINGSTVFKLDLSNCRQGQVCDFVYPPHFSSQNNQTATLLEDRVAQ